jgi:hypothetical protein
MPWRVKLSEVWGITARVLAFGLASWMGWH